MPPLCETNIGSRQAAVPPQHEPRGQLQAPNSSLQLSEQLALRPTNPSPAYALGLPETLAIRHDELPSRHVAQLRQLSELQPRQLSESQLHQQSDLRPRQQLHQLSETQPRQLPELQLIQLPEPQVRQLSDLQVRQLSEQQLRQLSNLQLRQLSELQAAPSDLVERMTRTTTSPTPYSRHAHLRHLSEAQAAASRQPADLSVVRGSGQCHATGSRQQGDHQSISVDVDDDGLLRRRLYSEPEYYSKRKRRCSENDKEYKGANDDDDDNMCSSTDDAATRHVKAAHSHTQDIAGATSSQSR